MDIIDKVRRFKKLEPFEPVFKYNEGYRTKDHKAKVGEYQELHKIPEIYT